MRLHAIITDAAMMPARGAPNMTRLTVLHRHLHGRALREMGFDNQPRRRRRGEGKRILCRRRRRETVQVPRQDARVRHGGVDEGGEADEGEVGEDDWDGGGDAVPEPGGLEDEEEDCGDDDEDAGGDVDGAVAGVLEAAAEEEARVAGEGDVVLFSCAFFSRDAGGGGVGGWGGEGC
ncbi:hypothetical protein V502_04342 [Pseudogymnoascus sp. VKM F-4520 (FW-2644)]|nr:hypothetical protein V502_04342 [Pseudogymnoascus sp. VKM F-4520 (FW-2644)]